LSANGEERLDAHFFADIVVRSDTKSRRGFDRIILLPYSPNAALSASFGDQMTVDLTTAATAMAGETLPRRRARLASTVATSSAG
jgi:hypothetical protein